MGLNVAQILAEVSPEAPCGEDHWFEGKFYYDQAGRLLDEIVGAEAGMIAEAEPGSGDWRLMADWTETALADTKHLALVRYAMMADIHLNGLSGLVDGLQVFSSLLADQWEQVWPRPDDGDYEERLGEIQKIEDPLVLAALEGIEISVQGRVGGPYTLKQVIETGMDSAAPPEPPAEGDVEPSGPDVSPAVIEEAVSETLGKDPDFYPAMKREIEEARQYLEMVFNAVGMQLAGANIAFPNVHGRLDQLDILVSRALDVPLGEGVGEGEGGDGDGVAGVGEIRSRSDVLRALGKIIEFYERSEPTSPVPLMLERTKRVVSMNFMEIIDEFALDGNPPIKQVFGASESEEQY